MTTLQRILLILIIPAALAVAVNSTAQQQPLKSPFPKDAWGAYTWGGNAEALNPTDFPYMKGAAVVIGWKALEPENGVFKFDEVFGNALRHLAKYNYYAFLKVYYAPENFTPAWVFASGGVPKVDFPARIDPFRNVKKLGFPYFFDQKYIGYYYRFIKAFGDYVKSLPKNLQDRILFVQATEGSTGDPQGYKLAPLDSKYSYTPQQWETFRQNAWAEYVKAFTDAKGNLIKPLFVNEKEYSKNNAGNSAAPNTADEPVELRVENKWLMEKMPGNIIGLKEGAFSHGYDLSETQGRLKAYTDFRDVLATQGKMLFSRGEYDGEWKVVGWSTTNPEQAIYWSAFYALYCGLDMWNIAADAAKGDRFAPAFKIFNKYAGQHSAATAGAAFCALRQGLDASDSKTYPETTFGRVNRQDTVRYLNIAKAFASRGAMQADAKKATGGFMANRQADRYNDVGWQITPGDYEMFLHQVDADETSVGWWHAGPQKSIYGRFARGFDHAAGKSAMYFSLDPHFFADKQKSQKVTLNLIYLDKGTGKWSLNCNQGGKEKPALSITCANTGKWVEKQVTVDALFNQQLPKGADLILKYDGGDDTIFHLIEVNRTGN